MIAKTQRHVLPQLIDTVQKNHSYSTPEIIVLPIIAGAANYLTWLVREVKPVLPQFSVEH
jgi:uncharacterized protein involved in tolerance to divalent cations